MYLPFANLIALLDDLTCPNLFLLKINFTPLTNLKLFIISTELSVEASSIIIKLKFL